MESTGTWFYVGCFNGNKLKMYVAPLKYLGRCNWINQKKFSYVDENGAYWEGIKLLEADSIERLKEDVKKLNPRCSHNAFREFPSETNDKKRAVNEFKEPSNSDNNWKKRLAKKATHDEEQIENQKCDTSNQEIGNKKANDKRQMNQEPEKINEDLEPSAKKRQIFEPGSSKAEEQYSEVTDISENTSCNKRKASLRMKKTIYNYKEYDYQASDISDKVTKEKKKKMSAKLDKRKKKAECTANRTSTSACPKITIHHDRVSKLNKIKVLRRAQAGQETSNLHTLTNVDLKEPDKCRKKYKTLRVKYQALKAVCEEQKSEIQLLKERLRIISVSFCETLISSNKGGCITLQNFLDIKTPCFISGRDKIDKNLPVGYENKETNERHIGQGFYVSADQFDFLMEPRSPKKFVRDMAYAIFGIHTLTKSTVTGKLSNRNKSDGNRPPPKQLDTEKMNAIRDSLKYFLEDRKFERMSLTEKDYHFQKVGIYVSQLIADLKRKNNPKYDG